MICRLCLINIESTEAIALYLSSIDNYPSIYINIMEKYLHLKIPPNDPVSMSLCLVCAKTLRDFDRFYLMVEEKQKTLEITSITIKDEPPHEINCMVSNDYIQDQVEAIEEANQQLENDKDDENLTNTYEISHVADEHMSQEPDIKLEEFRAPEPEQEKEFPPEPNEGIAASSNGGDLSVLSNQQFDPNSPFETPTNPITLSTLLSLNEVTSNDLWIPNCEADLIYSFIPTDIVLQDAQRAGLSKSTFKGLKRSSTERVRAWRQRQREKMNGMMCNTGSTFKGLKKSSTEKVRAWRQRQKEKMKSNLSEVAPIHALQLSEVTFNNPLNTANPKVRKSSAEKVRAWRQKQKEKMKANLSEGSLNANQISETNSCDTNNQQNPIEKKSSAAKVREWRQRQKEKMKANLSEGSMNQNQISETNSCDTINPQIPNTKKSSAEKVRAWRQRQKEKMKASMNLNQLSETTSSDPTNTTSPNKKKSSAEKVREWRQRQKEKMKANLSEITNKVSDSSDRPSDDICSTAITTPKSISSPEKLKVESPQQKQKAEDDLSEGSSNAIQISDTISEAITSIKKSSAEKVRAWRQRKRDKMKASLSEDTTNDIDLRKSSTERVRAWRQRQREKNRARELLLQNITSNDFSNLKSPGRKLSSTERVRAWRQKQREKRNASIALSSAQCLEVLIKEENVIPSDGGVQGWSQDQLIKPEQIDHHRHLDPYS